MDSNFFCNFKMSLFKLKSLGFLFRCEKVTLLRWEYRKRFKLTLTSSSYPLTSGRCINNRAHLFAQHATCTFYKSTIFHKSSPNNLFFVEQTKMNMSAMNKHTINPKHPRKLLLMRILTERVDKQPGVQFFFAILKCLCLS